MMDVDTALATMFYAIALVLVALACMMFIEIWNDLRHPNKELQDNFEKAEKALKKISVMTKNHDTVVGVASVTADRLSEALEEWNPNWHGWDDKK